MSIGVQSTNAAQLALQTLGRLSDAPAAGDAAAASAAAPASPAVVAGSAIQGLNANSLSAATASLNLASSITDSALSAGASISDLLDQMKSLAGQVQDGSTQGQTANSDFSALLSHISAAVSGAGFQGVNLLDGSSAPSVTIGSGAGAVTLPATNLSLGQGVITLGQTASLSTPTAAADVLSHIDESLANVDQALGPISDQSTQISAHANFVSRLSAVLSAGGDAASAPTSAEGAKLMALNVQQQLSASSSGIASAAPNVVLSLFQ
jgi:flagellin